MQQKLNEKVVQEKTYEKFIAKELSYRNTCGISHVICILQAVEIE